MGGAWPYWRRWWLKPGDIRRLSICCDEPSKSFPIIQLCITTLVRRMGGAAGTQEAVPVFRRALELDNRDAKAHYNFAKILKDSNHFDEAITALREAIRLEPGMVEAYENLGNIYKDQGRMDEALPLYRQSSLLKPDDTLRYANHLYSLTFDPGSDAAAILKAHEPWDRRCCQPLRQNIRRTPTPPSRSGVFALAMSGPIFAITANLFLRSRSFRITITSDSRSSVIPTSPSPTRLPAASETAWMSGDAYR